MYRRHLAALTLVAALTLAMTAALVTAPAGRAASAGPLKFLGSAGPLSERALIPETSTFSLLGLMRPAFATPMPSATPIGPAGPELTASFDGLSNYDQAGVNGGYFGSLDPPFPTLCAGNGQVLEAVSNALTVYSADGSALSPVVSLNTFFGRPTAFLTEPKCYYDAGTNRFFVTIALFGQNGTYAAPTAVLIAVSKTGDATGGWFLYSIDTTDDGTNGTPSHAACPCLADDPLIGADRNGFYVSTNEFSIEDATANGAQIYALSKKGLESGAKPPVVRFQNLPQSTGTTIQPATSPNAAQYDKANGGVEFFMSALDPSQTGDNRIAVWAMKNTRSLNDAVPHLQLQSLVVPSEAYAPPPDVVQKGSTATLTSFSSDIMSQVVYSRGSLWSGLDTAYEDMNATTNSGIAWFKVSPSIGTGGTLHATVVKQGYVAPTTENVTRPAIGVSPAGNAVMSMTLAGPDYYPSAAYSVFSGKRFNTIQVAGAGVASYYGFGRWGEFSAAVATPEGTVWLANEYIGGGPTAAYMNWSTRISSVITPRTLSPGSTNCNGLYDGTGADVVVLASATCTLVPGTHVTNTIIVNQGGTLHMNGVKLGGNLSTHGNATVCGSTIARSVVAAQGALALGGPGCAGNTITGYTFVTNDAREVTIWGNTIKSDLIVKNLTGATDSIVGNHVFGDLLVAHSGPPVEVSGNQAINLSCNDDTGLTGSGNSGHGTNTCHH
jgi:hypothetical protein